MMQTAAPSARKKSISTWANQMWTLIDRVRVDDLIVLPRKATSQIALGVVTQEYWYNDDSEPDWRHVVSVDWQCTDVPRTAVKQDLLYSLGSALTICTITRNDGKWRLHQLLKTGADPGARSKPTFARDADADPGHTDSDATDSADQGLLVAWGGVNQPARREMRSQFFRVRVWDADDLLDAVFRNYDKLDEALQAELPLKRIWNLVED
ncbi:MAG: hypothetical protein OXH86_12525 [Acidimicrobiaceae bacterium]|nr:hypothetical protein [Acidimicrobiaceae bacterium]